VDNLSSEEIELLVFLGSFLVEDYTGGILLIDETKLHLHPAWHRKESACDAEPERPPLY